MISFTIATTNEELQQILELQQKNLSKNLTLEETLEQGFLTVEHDFPTLKRMNNLEPATIAKENNHIVGFLLAMTKDLRNAIPILISMFDILDELEYKGQKLQEYNYIVVGQACIAESHRGSGIFDQCYAAYKKHLSEKYDFAVTEISRRNQRSLRAHRRVGFEFLQEFVAPNGEVWDIVMWDWQKNQ